MTASSHGRTEAQDTARRTDHGWRCAPSRCGGDTRRRRDREFSADRTTAASDRLCCDRMPRASCGGAGCESADPGCLVGAGVVDDRGPVVAVPDVADLAVAQPVNVDAVPLDVASAGGDGEDGALLGAAHDHAHHNLVALAEDVVNR